MPPSKGPSGRPCSGARATPSLLARRHLLPHPASPRWVLCWFPTAHAPPSCCMALTCLAPVPAFAACQARPQAAACPRNPAKPNCTGKRGGLAAWDARFLEDGVRYLKVRANSVGMASTATDDGRSQAVKFPSLACAPMLDDCPPTPRTLALQPIPEGAVKGKRCRLGIPAEFIEKNEMVRVCSDCPLGEGAWNGACTDTVAGLCEQVDPPRKARPGFVRVFASNAWHSSPTLVPPDPRAAHHCGPR